MRGTLRGNRMSSLAQWLAQGTPKFNALRAQGKVPIDQSGSTLSQLFFARADLSKLDLSNAEFDECTVSDSDLRGVDLTGAYVHGGRYERCDFRGAQLAGATFEHVEFVECDFTGALGLDDLELDDVTGLGVVSPTASVLSEEPKFVAGHVAINETLERELDAHPDDAARWLVYADWLQGEGDLRGELITRQGKDGFDAFVDEHLEALFGSCADEVRGGGQVPEVVLEWRHGFVHGATLAALNRERVVNLAELLTRLLPLPICRFLKRLSFGLNHEVAQYGERQNDYAPIVAALTSRPELARIEHLEFGLQEPVIDEEFGEREPLHPFGDLSALWPSVPHLKRLRVKGGAGVLGELVLPELREVALQLENHEENLFDEVVAARWPKLERFELWDDGGQVELAPLLHVLEALPLTHLALPFTQQLERLIPLLVGSPLLKRLRVLDLHDARFEGNALEVLRKNAPALKHLQRVDLTGAADAHEEEVLSKLGAFFVFRAPVAPEPEEPDSSWYDDFEDSDYEPGIEIEAPNADLDIPDEHGDA